MTIDAMGTQTKIARTIRERGAHYVLCVKENHPNLYDSILFADIDHRGPLTPSSTHETTLKGHGGIEVRRCRAYTGMDLLYKSEDWQDRASFAVVERKHPANPPSPGRLGHRRSCALVFDGGHDGCGYPAPESAHA